MASPNTAGQQLADLYGKSFGYLSASDLSMWLNPQALISALNLNPQAATKAVNQALAMISSRLTNVWDLRPEFLLADTVAPQLTCTVDAVTGAINGTKIVYPGTNFITPPQIAVVANGAGANGAVSATVSPTIIATLDLLERGIRYNQPPNISFVGDGAGATATCTIDKCGRILTLTLLTGGQGWTKPPQVVFTPVDGAGFGAVAVANLQYGQISALHIDTPGAGYATAPSLVVSGGQVSDPRYPKMVMLASIYAVRILVGNAANISEEQQAAFKMGDELILEMLNGGAGMPLIPASKSIRSGLTLVKDSFNMLG